MLRGQAESRLSQRGHVVVIQAPGPLNRSRSKNDGATGGAVNAHVGYAVFIRVVERDPRRRGQDPRSDGCEGMGAIHFVTQQPGQLRARLQSCMGEHPVPRRTDDDIRIDRVACVHHTHELFFRSIDGFTTPLVGGVGRIAPCGNGIARCFLVANHNAIGCPRGDTRFKADLPIRAICAEKPQMHTRIPRRFHMIAHRP